MNFLHRLLCVILLLSMSAFAQDKAAKPETDSSYVLRANDQITIDVFGVGELTDSTQILRTGEATFKLIGPVKIAGLTVRQATQRLIDLYADGYLINPEIKLGVGGYATDTVSVLGSVNQPGPVAIPASGVLDLATAMASAGGLTPRADKNAIALHRLNGGVTTYSEASLRGDGGKVRLSSGDRVIVSESRFVDKTVLVQGQVSRQGPVPFPADGKLDLVTAISLAGGMTPLANPKKVIISRRGVEILVNYEEVSTRGDRPYQLSPDDVIIVKERWF